MPDDAWHYSHVRLQLILLPDEVCERADPKLESDLMLEKAQFETLLVKVLAERFLDSLCTASFV